MSTRKMLMAFVTVLLLAAAIAGVDAWKTYAQGPDGNNPPCGQTYSGHGMGMMGGQFNESCTGGMMGGQSMMGHHGMMGGHHQSGMMGRQGMMGMWNFSAGADAAEMTVSLEQAHEAAQLFLDSEYSGLTVSSEANTFHGHYAFVVLEGENTVGMLGVDGYTGQVWFHHWRDGFSASTETAE
ncbi:MAG: hypothetical protein HY866_11090 [Chloroflexi bacterium]|nr:hypothetical protein [Chloroflexota bacterium]